MIGTAAMFVWFFWWEHRLRTLMDTAQLSAYYYGADFANAWAAVLQPVGWTNEDTEPTTGDAHRVRIWRLREGGPLML